MEFLNTTIGKYTLTKYIGEGGMASVYEGTHLFLGTKAAIKVLSPMLAKNDQFRQRFRNEAAFMASLDHPNITKVLDFEDSDEVLAIVMELLEGSDLNDLVKQKGALSFEMFKPLFIQILDAFKYAHNKGIVHRDIKPSNIFIDAQGKVKILDFGIAKLFGQGNEMTQTGTQMGTPAYMSPEQVKGDKSIDHRSDIYSLGITLFYAMEGRSPYDTSNESQFDIFNKIVYEDLPELSANSDYTFLIQKACQKDRNSRYQQIEDFENALVGLLDNELKADRVIKTNSKPVLKADESKVDPPKEQTIDPTNTDKLADQKGIFNINRLLLLALLVTFFGVMVTNLYLGAPLLILILAMPFILSIIMTIFKNNKVSTRISIGLFALYWLPTSYFIYPMFLGGYVAPLIITCAAILSLISLNRVAIIFSILAFLLVNIDFIEFIPNGTLFSLHGIVFFLYLISFIVYFFYRKHFGFVVLISISILTILFVYAFFGSLGFNSILRLEDDLLFFLLFPLIELSSKMLSDKPIVEVNKSMKNRTNNFPLFVFLSILFFGSGIFFYDRSIKRGVFYIICAVYSWISLLNIFMLISPQMADFHNHTTIGGLSIFTGWIICYLIGTIDLIVLHKRFLKNKK
jgi:serine/threonine protein kinase